ncbi:MAG: ribonuclease HII [Candidatus Marsarchaeota archaeon]|nr:ribonuclease HII [Candidatus Marsarchaeota archaeon]
MVSVKKSKEAKFSKIGVRDSKMLTPRKREFLYDEIISIADEVRSYSISSEEIDQAIKSNVSLNQLEALNFARLIDSLKAEPNRVFLDSPDVISERFGMRVSLFSSRNMHVKGIKKKGQKNEGIVPADSKRISVIAEHKADSVYPVVSSASIIAKVTRDREIERITDHLGIDIGSGYPSDAQTIDAIKDNLANEKFAKFIRQRWKTMQIIRQARMNEFF